MNIVVTTYFLESVFSFDAKSRRAILSTIEALDTNPKSDALKIHKIDKTKCDNSFRSARVNDDIRVIFAMRTHGQSQKHLKSVFAENAWDISMIPRNMWLEERIHIKLSKATVLIVIIGKVMIT